ncbi:WecB/TagA/CpsF family glycosyltransferase [Pseudomonas fluorescens]
MNNSTKSINAFGVNISTLDMKGTVEYLFSESHTSHPIVREDMNAFKACLKYKSADVHTALNEADIINADGMSIVYAMRFLQGIKLPRVTGCDLLSELIKESHSRRKKIFLLGANEEVVSKLALEITNTFPENIVAGYRNGYFTKNEWPEIIEIIAASEAELVFIGTPSPQKEEFVNYAKKNIHRKIILMGVGGSFDVLSGKTKRAPLWMQNSGLEWFFRLTQEPGRMWRRYLTTNSNFIWLVIKEKLKIQQKKRQQFPQ